MIYLAIFLLVASAGITSLWLYQRHQRKDSTSIEGFRSLQRISSHQVVVPSARIERRTVMSGPRGPRRPEPLDPARREAARQRLARRRAARA